MSRKRPARLVVAAVTWIALSATLLPCALASLPAGSRYSIPWPAVIVLVAFAAAGMTAGIGLLRMKPWSRRFTQIVTWLLYPVALALGAGAAAMFFGLYAFGEGPVYGVAGLAVAAASLLVPGWILWAVGSRPARDALDAN